VRTYLTKINPIVDPALDDAGTLTFGNAAVAAKVAAAPGGYRAQWFTFDNVSRKTTPIGSESKGDGPRLSAPAGLPRDGDSFIKVQVSATQPPHESWTRPVDVYFRRASGGWKLVGLERLPE